MTKTRVNRIQKFRKEKKMSRLQVVVALANVGHEISFETLRRIELGMITPRLNIAMALADLYNVGVESFLNQKES